METVRFRLSIGPEQMKRHYRGTADQVIVRAEDGRRVQFPATWLRRFITAGGVCGLFEMRFGADRRLMDLERIGD